MIGAFVSLAYWSIIIWLLRQEGKQHRVSAATWIVVGWTVVYASRPITSWFGGGMEGGTAESYDEGNFGEALIYFSLLAAASIVLLRRGVRWSEVMRSNSWLAVFWIFWLASALLPVRRDVFDLESWPVRVIFDSDATGHVHAFHCAGPRLAWGTPPGVFERVA